MGSPVGSLNPYQFAFTPANSSQPTLTFGSGTPYIVESVDGLTSLPPLRNQDDNRGYIDGSWSGRDFYDARTITFQIVIIGNSSHNAQYYYNQLQQSLYPQQQGFYPSANYPASEQLGVLQFEITSITGLQRIYARVRSIETPLDPDFTYGYISSTIEFYCPDPRYYDDTPSTPSGSAVSVSNAGWATMCPMITIISPSASFTITDSNGYQMIFAGVNTSYPIVIDTLARTIYNNGFARQLMTYNSQWLSIPPFGSSTWTLSSGSMTVTYRNAYV